MFPADREVASMQDDVHPEYRPVVFRDQSSGETFLVGSTAPSEETVTVDGEEYPLVEVEVTSASHPFYTGEQKLIDTEGRVEKFKRKYGDRSGEDSEDEA